jgi:hypothetical protein
MYVLWALIFGFGSLANTYIHIFANRQEYSFTFLSPSHKVSPAHSFLMWRGGVRQRQNYMAWRHACTVTKTSCNARTWPNESTQSPVVP